MNASLDRDIGGLDRNPTYRLSVLARAEPPLSAVSQAVRGLSFWRHTLWQRLN
jgi:hypothetical protein